MKKEHTVFREVEDELVQWRSAFFQYLNEEQAIEVEQHPEQNSGNVRFIPHKEKQTNDI